MPVFVAIIVWLIRVLIIGTFSVAGERIFSQDDSPRAKRGLQFNTAPARKPAQTQTRRPRPAYTRTSNPAPRPSAQPSFRPANNSRPEPTYHPITMQAKSNRTSSGRDYRQDQMG